MAQGNVIYIQNLFHLYTHKQKKKNYIFCYSVFTHTTSSRLSSFFLILLVCKPFFNLYISGFSLPFFCQVFLLLFLSFFSEYRTKVLCFLLSVYPNDINNKIRWSVLISVCFLYNILALTYREGYFFFRVFVWGFLFYGWWESFCR